MQKLKKTTNDHGHEVFERRNKHNYITVTMESEDAVGEWGCIEGGEKTTTKAGEIEDFRNRKSHAPIVGQQW
jgi:hypothetical protein